MSKLMNTNFQKNQIYQTSFLLVQNLYVCGGHFNVTNKLKNNKKKARQVSSQELSSVDRV